MFTLHAELARERILEARRVAERYRVSRRLASARRWRWLEHMARSAHARHARAAAESAASTVHSPLISRFGHSARRVGRPTAMSQPEVSSS